MSEMNPQIQTDQEKAKAKLQEVQERKEAQNTDPRGTAVISAVPRRPATDADKSADIRPVAAKPKKKKFGTKLREAMFSEDIGKGGVVEYVFFKICVPSFKRVISEMANTAINMALGLDPKTRTVGSGNTHTANASVYRDRNYYRQGGSEVPSYRRRNAISEFEWDEATAKDIFSQMSDLIEQYGNCSLADAYEIMGMSTSIRTTDKDWGWTSMRNADVVAVDRFGDRWIVDMPEARPLR